MRMEQEEQKNYEPPLLEAIGVEVEKGFSESDGVWGYGPDVPFE